MLRLCSPNRMLSSFTGFCASPLSSVLLCLIASGSALAQEVTWSAVPFNMQSIPLAVKNACNSAWSPQASGSNSVSASWPRSWDATLDDKSWYAAVRVDGTPYQILGGQSVPTIATAIQIAVVVTPTRSSYLLNAGPIVINMTFLSPVEPGDLVKMSSPFSYLYFTFTSNDTNVPHDVELYSDITGEWISGDTNLEMTWSGGDDGSLTIVQASLSSPQQFQINTETCQDGTVYFAMQSNPKTTWQIGPCTTLRPNFANGVALTNSSTLPPLGIFSDSDGWTTFAIAVDVGSVSTTTSPFAYTLGVVRDPVIQYTNQQLRSPYYRVSYTNPRDLIAAVFNNFTESVVAAQKLDTLLAAAGGDISGNYSDLLAISTRQAFGAFDLTIPQPALGGVVNASDVKAFARDFGKLGSGGVNAVDVLYAAMPAYIYLWPDLLGYLLNPLLEYQESDQYTNIYAAEDIGANYPNATGNTGPHNSQIEQSANMIIMALAHAQTSGDGSLLVQYYDLLASWADFLANTTLSPDTEETTSISDGIVGANQTNLALKGVIAIGAMAKISGYSGKTDDQSYYQTLAEQYSLEWTTQSVTPDFVSLTYGSGSSGVIYNLYADKLLRTNLISNSVYSVQANYYDLQAGSASPYGIPLAADNETSRTDWMMFAAAAATEDSVRDFFVDCIHAYASASVANSNYPFPVSIDLSSAEVQPSSSDYRGINSFAQGAMFAPLALNVSVMKMSSTSPTQNVTSTELPLSTPKEDIGPILGGVIGGLGAIGLVFLSMACYYRKRLRVPKGINVQGGQAHTRSQHGSFIDAFQGYEDRSLPEASAPYDCWSTAERQRTNPHSSLVPNTGRIASMTFSGERADTIDRPQGGRQQSSSPAEMVLWAGEMAELRREIERLREEHRTSALYLQNLHTPSIPPPSYQSVAASAVSDE